MRVLSDVEWIFVVLGILYLGETLVWVRPGTIPFLMQGRQFRNPLRPFRLLGNDRGSLLLGPLLPSKATFLVEAAPLSISEDGIVGFVPFAPMQHQRREHSEHFVTWDSAKKLYADDLILYVGERPLCTTQSKRTAKNLCQTLRKIADLPPADRIGELERWGNSMVSIQEARQWIERWEKATKSLRWSAMALCFWTFPIGLTLYYHWLPIVVNQQVITCYLVLFFVLWAITNLFEVVAHRKLYPDERLSRYKLGIMSCLSPIVPMRAADHLARNLFPVFHPLTFSAAVHPDVLFAELAGQTLRDLRHPRSPTMPEKREEVAKKVCHASNVRTDKGVQQLLDQRPVACDRYLTPTESFDPSAVSYCPRCLAEHATLDSLCHDCGGLATVPIEGNQTDSRPLESKAKE